MRSAKILVHKYEVRGCVINITPYSYTSYYDISLYQFCVDRWIEQSCEVT